MAEQLPDTIYWSDPLHDEFSVMKMEYQPITEDYRYIRNDTFLGKLAHFFYFRVIGKPIAKIYLHHKFRHEIVGKWKLKPYKKLAVFMYGNHTQIIGDALMPAFMVSPRPINVIVHPNNIHIPGIGKYVPHLGGLPLPGDKKAKVNFDKAIDLRVKQHQPIFIYPEAHIWPYYTKIRPFVSDSFIYPVYYGMPVFCFTNTYHERKNGKVRIRTYIDGPFWPNPELNPKAAREDLRNRVYNQMVERSNLSTYEKIKYIEKTDD